MSCKNCGFERILAVNAKCSDNFTMWFNNNEYRGYVPKDAEIGGGDYIKLEYCLDCGQIQGDFPVDRLEIEDEAVEEGEVDEI